MTLVGLQVTQVTQTQSMDYTNGCQFYHGTKHRVRLKFIYIEALCYYILHIGAGIKYDLRSDCSTCEWEIANAEGPYAEAVVLISMFAVQLLRILPVCAASPCYIYSRHNFWIEMKRSTGIYLCSVIHIRS